jgi:ATP-binding cassette subfamily B protein RaxB
MVAGFFGRRTSLHVLRARLPTSARGATLNDLMIVAAELGIVGRPVRLEPEDLVRLKLPAVLHWRLDHFVVLVAMRKGRAIVHDPSCGRVVVSPKQLDQAFTGVALELSLAAGFAASDEREGLSLRAVFASCRNLGRYLALMLFLLCMIQLLSLVPPVATQLLIDEVVLGLELPWLHRALAGLSAVLVATALLEAMRRRIALHAGTSLAVEATQNVVRHLYALPVQYLQGRQFGDVVSRLESLGPIRRAITETAVNGIVQAVVVLATLAIMLFYSPPLTLVSLGGMLAAALLLWAVMPASRRLGERVLVCQARQDSSLLETLRTFPAVHALGLATLRLAQWQNHFVADGLRGSR